MAEPLDLVAQSVRAADPDRYLAALYAPAEKRSALFALYAFNAEVAGIRSRVREALPGEVRLQWWHDTIDVAGTVSGHPVADALNDAIRRHGLPIAAFHNLLDARIFDLYDDPMPSQSDLEGYCGETEGAIMQLSALILDVDAATSAAELSGRAACAEGITGMLRSTPVHLARGQCYIPRDILAAAGSSPEEFLTADRGQGALRAVEAMTALARDHLAAFEADASALPLSLRPAFLPLAVTALQLSAMASPAAVLRGVSNVAAWRRQWAVFRRAAKGWPASQG